MDEIVDLGQGELLIGGIEPVDLSALEQRIADLEASGSTAEEVEVG